MARRKEESSGLGSNVLSASTRSVRSAFGSLRYKNKERELRRKARKRQKKRKKRYMEPMSAVSSRSGFKKLTGRLSAQLRKGLPGNIPLPFFKELPETWPHYLEQYGQCDQDLSEIDRPMCFQGFGFMPPPEAFNESKRTAETKKFMSKRKWNDNLFFEKLLIPVMRGYNVSGLSISLLDRTKQIAKYQSGLAMDMVARNVSIDGHAILSKDRFVLLDASSDWRMIYNPLVHGPPFIKFYVGVPLFNADNIRIGVIAAFDSFARTSLPQGLDQDLQEVSRRITQFLIIPPSAISPRIESAEEDEEMVEAGSNKENNDPDENLMYGNELGTFNRNGLPGLLPHNFHVKHDMNSLKRLNCNPQLKQSYQISRELATCISAKSAVEKASKILADALGLSFVYVVEIRISSFYKVSPAQSNVLKNGTACRDISDLDQMLGSEHDRKVYIRLLGGTGITNEDLKFDQDIHAFALDSNYGIQYDAPDERLSYRSGIFMPCHKSEARIIHINEANNSDNKSPGVLQGSRLNIRDHQFVPRPEHDVATNDFKFLDTPHDNETNEEAIFTKFAKLSLHKQQSQPRRLIKIRHGGYIMAGFSVLHRSFSPGDIEYMKLCVRGLENVFSSS